LVMKRSSAFIAVFKQYADGGFNEIKVGAP
jgi:hypothetical protein